MSLFVFSLLLGGAISTLGTLSNLLVIFGTEMSYRSRSYCALHTMYGLASALGPLVVARFMTLGLSWQMTLIPCLALLIGLAATPIRQVPSSQARNDQKSEGVSLIGWIVIATFVIYVLGEILTSIWMVTFLVEARGFSVQSAAPYLTLFFILMAVSRIVCAVRMTETTERNILWVSQILFVAFVAMGQRGHPIFLSLSGIIGPFFPLLMARVTRHFGVMANNLVLKIYLAIPLSTALVNFAVGKATATYPLEHLYATSLLFGLATLPLLGLYLHRTRSVAH